jgi:DNA-binding NtrC family response regulator
MASIVIIEDEALLSKQLVRALAGSAHEVQAADSGESGLKLVQEVHPDLVLLDLRLPDRSGLDLLLDIRQLDATLPVILMTAYGSVSDAVEAMRRGATDYLQKPLDLDELRLTVQRIVTEQRRNRELTYLRERTHALPGGPVGDDPWLRTIFAQVERLRAAGLPPGKRPTILITGETGTGKGVMARAIHEQLGGGPFIEVNCTAMPATLVEAELFGHERGAFTDGKSSRSGLFEAAEGGAVFLDEIGHLETGLQTKFLKVIEEKRIRRLGSTRDRAVDVHVIAATNRDLDAAVREGSFREDLLHRLRVLCFEIPPLRERKDDVRLLARHFCQELGALYGGRARTISAEAEALLARYTWPGNVRELRNVIERAVLLGASTALDADDFCAMVCAESFAAADPSSSPEFALPEGGIDLATLERSLIQQALARTGGNRTQAAALLGLSRDTLRYRLEKFELE